MTENLASQVKVSEETIDKLEPSFAEASSALGPNKMALIFLKSAAEAFKDIAAKHKQEFDEDVRARSLKSLKKGEKVSYIETSLVMKKNEGYLLAYSEIENMLRSIIGDQEEVKPVKSIKKPRKAKVTE